MVIEEPNISDKAKLNTTQTAKVLGIHINTVRIKSQVEQKLAYSIGKNGRPYFLGKSIKKFWREN